MQTKSKREVKCSWKMKKVWGIQWSIPFTTQLFQMKICAVILNYFGWQDTAACCAALAGQDIAALAVVENSASSGERRALDHFCTGIANASVLAPAKNLGFAGGVNFALRHMLPQGFAAFLLMNNDTVVPVDLIGKLTRGADAAAFDIASPVIYRYPEKDSLWSKGNYYNIWSGLITNSPLPLPGNVFYLPGCCLLVRTRVFETIGLFNEEFFMYGEDVAFCHRAAAAGFRIGVVSDACLYHKTGASAIQNSLFYETCVNRAHLLLSNMLHNTAIARRISLSIKLLVLLLRAIVRTVRFANGNSLRGYGSALRGFFAHQRVTRR